MNQPVKYFSDSWRMLNKSGKGWIGPVILLAILQLIPIVGQIALLGYAYQWSTRTAWGMDTAPQDRSVEIGKIFTLGGITFVVMLVWSIVIGIVSMALSYGFAWIPVLGFLLSIVISVLSVFATTLMIAAMQRSAIYRHIWPGFQLDKLFEIFRRDWGGLIKISLIYFLISLIVGIIIAVIILIPLFFVMGIGGIGLAGFESMDSSAMVDGGDLGFLMGLIVSFGGLFLLILLIAAIVTVLIYMLYINSVALWFRQFRPDTWGSYNDPLPAKIPSDPYYTYKPQSPSDTNPANPSDFSADEHYTYSQSASVPIASTPINPDAPDKDPIQESSVVNPDQSTKFDEMISSKQEPVNPDEESGYDIKPKTSAPELTDKDESPIIQTSDDDKKVGPPHEANNK
ncbi:MAG: DUF4013 domain-containing protein [Coriobacteriia bacterium]|nr:DUF4013 domain-containing protein [Coriobacteriia bacterium]